MPGPRGPMGGGRTVEKPANFGNVMGKLVHYCRNYLPVIIIALVLGAPARYARSSDRTSSRT